MYPYLYINSDCSENAEMCEPPENNIETEIVMGEPPDHLLYTLVITICCCFPLGIFAISKSFACKRAKSDGDLDTAWRYSADARKLGNFTLGVGIFFMIITLIICGAAYAFGAMPDHKKSTSPADHSAYD